MNPLVDRKFIDVDVLLRRAGFDCHVGIAHRLPDLSGIEEMIAVHGRDAVPAIIIGGRPGEH